MPWFITGVETGSGVLKPLVDVALTRVSIGRESIGPIVVETIQWVQQSQRMKYNQIQFGW